MTDESLLDLRVSELLDAVASREPAPGGGSVSALAAALAAGLVAMAARFAPEDVGPRWAEGAELLRRRATALVDADATAYRRYLAAARTARTSGEAGHAAAAHEALSAATDVPLAVAAVAAEVAALAAVVAAGGNPRLRGDAVTAVHLAAAAAGTSVVLVRQNVSEDDLRVRRATAAATSARAAVDAVCD